MDVYISGKRVRLDPSLSIGKGGEADVYKLGTSEALKIFKAPNHPDFDGQPAMQQAAKERIEEHQKKLPAFPKNLPPTVVTPRDFANNKAGNRILGYSMLFQDSTEVLLRYAERAFRQAGITQEMVTKIFLNLHETVSGVHEADAVIGDFNDLNVLVRDTSPLVIDADSMQFGGFYCQVFTERFVDPLLCQKQGGGLMLTKPHNSDSDWYAFAIMLMQCLLFVGPYGGIFKPKEKKKRVVHNERPLHRITVFNAEVKYPKPAIPYSVLPDDLLQHLHLVFEKDQRGDFPRNLLEALRWTKCSDCGMEHARALCPGCSKASPVAIKEVITVRGKVTATRIFQTKGVILHVAMQNNKLLWLYHEGNQYKREDDTAIAPGNLDPRMRFRFKGKTTLIGKGDSIAVLKPGERPGKIAVDQYRGLPMFDANENHMYWTIGGQLVRDDRFGKKNIGGVLSGQTLFWVGSQFGFGLYRAGNLSISFVFTDKGSAINTNVKLPPIRGQLIDATCSFAADRCWFFLSVQEAGKTINRCTVIRSNGSIEAVAEAEQGEDSWLGGSIRGHCAAGNFLLVSTDEGIIKVESASGNITKTQDFPDTEPFVDSDSHIFPGSNGIYVSSKNEIYLLKIS